VRTEHRIHRRGRSNCERPVPLGETALLWDKLAFPAPLALLTMHAGAPAGVVRDERRADLETVIGEVAAVAGAAGARVEPTRILGMFDRVPAGMKSSMQRDAEAKRPTELDAIGGAVLRASRTVRGLPPHQPGPTPRASSACGD
jgi:2-dehydropantoate 2-reductase